MAGGALRFCGLCRHLEVRPSMNCQQLVNALCSVVLFRGTGNACAYM